MRPPPSLAPAWRMPSPGTGQRGLAAQRGSAGARLNGTGRPEAVLERPLVAQRGKVLEGGRAQLHQRLGNDRLVEAMLPNCPCLNAMQTRLEGVR